MWRTLLAVATLLSFPAALRADEKSPPGEKTPPTESLTVLNASWVKPDGKVAATMIRAVPETRMATRTALRIIDGMQVPVTEEVPYTVMRSVACTIQADTTDVLDIQGKPISPGAVASRLDKAGPVLLARGRLDPALRPILKDEVTVLVAPGGVAVQGAPEGPRWLPWVTLASMMERDGEVVLRLVESEAVRAREKRITLIDGQEVERTVE